MSDVNDPNKAGTSASGAAWRIRIEETLSRLKQDRIMDRIRTKDHTVWKSDPKEISNRLGWLTSAADMMGRLGEIEAFVTSVREAGLTHAVLLGMGGSSLAPEVFAKTFGSKPGHPSLSVLDSTDPATVLRHVERLDPARTLFIVSSKSGTTVEILSLFKFFYRMICTRLGNEKAGEHFAAITDPGSGLAGLAEGYRFRHVFLNDPDIGGRFSVLSCFGLVPAALIGVDVKLLLERALAMRNDNAGERLGALLGTSVLSGRDKLTLRMPPDIQFFADWAEQLIAESTGKEGKGILPVIREAPGKPAVYGPDRLFVLLDLAGEPFPEAFVSSMEKDGHPVEILHLQDLYDLGGQFVVWMTATAVAGHILGINPFDQPDVEAAKVMAREAVDAFRASGRLPDERPAFRFGGVDVYGSVQGTDTMSALEGFLEDMVPGSYIAILAYLSPSDETDILLQVFRTRLRDRYRVPVTVGYGPRYLHSTGQLHKGDGGRGVFIQLTADDGEDVPIPDGPEADASSLTFGTLKAAQATGDRLALAGRGRRILRLHLGPDSTGRLALLTEGIF